MGSNVAFTSGIPETILPPPPGEASRRLRDALAAPVAEQRVALAAVAATFPKMIDAWVALGDVTTDPIEAYAYYRVGYHRGLDALRHAGWRGSGYVRWEHESNRGFLRALEGLRRQAAAIGETDEAERCAQFLRQLDPDHY